MTIPLDTVLPIYSFINHSSRSKVEWFIFYLCSCLSTQFLYRTAVKATFNVKDNIKDNIKNSITLIINITTSPTIFRKIQVAKPHLFLIISYVNYSTVLFKICL